MGSQIRAIKFGDFIDFFGNSIELDRMHNWNLNNDSNRVSNCLLCSWGISIKYILSQKNEGGFTTIPPSINHFPKNSPKM